MRTIKTSRFCRPMGDLWHPHFLLLRSCQDGRDMTECPILFMCRCSNTHGYDRMVRDKVSPSFESARIQRATSRFKCKRHGFCEQRGGDWGNREELINELIGRMN
eukprot:TRINITY_DN38728_c0_g1_i1.p2 TRINITY_DN38728_c0_g1~~TRINITY_DN38728_c0_g1_i1.p2  ORF type:complete len:105 (+),score=7.79 TRINITY_DN38728_c0_g1_i1:493-807(+)